MNKQCKYCGKIFDVRPSHYPKVTYCSKLCMAQDYRVRMIGNDNPNFKNAGQHICIGCGKQYKHFSNTRKYCSRDCYNKNGDMKRNLGEYTQKDNKKRPSSISICAGCGVVIEKYKRKYCDDCLSRFYKSKRTTPRRVDANQNKIVTALIAHGCSVLDASAMGGGFPDLIVGYRHTNLLIEVKNPETKGKLNAKQKQFFETWKGQTTVIRTEDEAIQLLEEVE